MKHILYIALVFVSVQLFGQGSGNAIVFDGNNDHVELNDVIPNGDFTIEFWFMPEQAIWSGVFLDKTEIGGGGANRKYFFVDGNQNRVRFYFEDANDRDVQCRANYSFNAGQWYHVACVGGFNRNAPHRLYINGILMDTENDNTSGKPGSLAPTIWLGENQSNYAVVNAPFDGRMDEMKIWSYARTENEIRADMCKKMTGGEAGLSLYYRMDEIAGTSVINDLSGNGNDGTLLNFNLTNAWRTSGAAIGDGSAFVYTTNWAGVTLTYSANDNDSLMVSNMAGANLEGMHIYKVEELPNDVTGIAGLGGNNHYYGVFKVAQSGGSYDASYFYRENDAYQNSVNISDVDLAMFLRDNNAAGPWNNAFAILDAPNKELSVNTSNTEFILGLMNGGALPVVWEFVEVKQLGKKAKVEWGVLSESNVSHYEVLRSSDGVNFYYIGEEAVRGNSGNRNRYEFMDQSPMDGISYYRIREIDNTGETSLSKVVVLSMDEAAMDEVVIYPNPSAGIINLNGIDSFSELDIYTITGKLIYHENVSSDMSVINLSEKVKEGYYFIRLSSTENTITRRVSISY